MPTIQHIHTYVRYKSRDGFYRCDSPDCTHFIDKESIQGKLSLCTECGAQMTLDREALRRARPKCLSCSQTKKAKAFRKAQELTRYLGTESFQPLSGSFASENSEGEEEPEDPEGEEEREPEPDE